jgi:hypothetical protein
MAYCLRRSCSLRTPRGRHEGPTPAAGEPVFASYDTAIPFRAIELGVKAQILQLATSSEDLSLLFANLKNSVQPLLRCRS